LICKREKCPKFIKLLDRHETAYLQAEDFIRQPPKGVKVFEIKPQRPLATKVLGSSQQDIISDYKYGFELGRRFLESTKSVFEFIDLFCL